MSLIFLAPKRFPLRLETLEAPGISIDWMKMSLIQTLLLVTPPREIEDRDRISRMIPENQTSWLDKRTGEPEVECLYPMTKRDRVSKVHEVSMLLSAHLKQPGQNLKSSHVWQLGKQMLGCEIIGRLDFNVGNVRKLQLNVRHDADPPHHVGLISWPIHEDKKLHKPAMMALAEQLYSKRTWCSRAN